MKTMKRCKYEEEAIFLAYDELDEAGKNHALAHIENCNYCKNIFLEYKRCSEAIKSLEAAPVPHLDCSRLREAILSRELKTATRLNLSRAFAFSAFVMAVVSVAVLLPKYIYYDVSTRFVLNPSNEVANPSAERVANNDNARTLGSEEEVAKLGMNQPSEDLYRGKHIEKSLKKSTKPSPTKKPPLVATSQPRRLQNKVTEDSTNEEVSKVVLAASLGAGSSTIETAHTEDGIETPVVLIQPGNTGFPAGAMEVKSPEDVSIGG